VKEFMADELVAENAGISVDMLVKGVFLIERQLQVLGDVEKRRRLVEE
jgi:hypothetical protein